MTFISRAQWGARPPRSTGNAISAHPLGVAIHYTAANLGSSPDSECDDKVRGIQRYHQDTKGWADIAYSFLVCPHGNVFEGRGTGKGSAANGTTVGNLNWYAVCALGGPADTPSPQMLAAIGDAVNLCRAAGAGARVIGHRDLFATACPGVALYAYVQSGRWNTLVARVVAVVSRVLTRAPIAKPAPARYPLPAGHWFGIRSSNPRNHSGYYAADRPAIKAIQTKVGVTPDGDYGTNTRAHVIRWQAARKITADGAVGPQTWTALNR